MGGDPGPRPAGRFPRLGGSSSSGRSAVITGLALLMIVDVGGAAFYTAWTLIGLALVSEGAPQCWLHLRRLRRGRGA
jgi:hypothetical protein